MYKRQVLLHLGRKVNVHDIGKLGLHQFVDGAAQARGHQLFLLALHIIAVDDGGDDGRVGGRAADAVFLQRFDQRGLGVSRGRLGELLLALHAFHLQHVALGKGRQGRLFLFLLVGRFLIQAREAVERDGVAAGLEGVRARSDVRGHSRCV